MSRSTILLGLAMTAAACPGGDAAMVTPLAGSDAIGLMLIIHNNSSVFDGMPRLPRPGCPPASAG